MKFTENNLFEILLNMETSYKVAALKAEFEDEGASFEDVSTLKSLADKVGIDFTLKIGGCGALNDLKQSKILNVTSIVAPMIESPYACKKFIKAVNSVYEKSKMPKLFINIETVNGYKNFDEISKIQEFSEINGIVLGRFDMSKSLGGGCQECDSKKLFDLAENLALKCQIFGKKFIIGGGIKASSIDFLKQIPYLTAFETRKIVFNSNILKNKPDKAIVEAINFEIAYLECKNNGDNSNRINSLKKRIDTFLGVKL